MCRWRWRWRWWIQGEGLGARIPPPPLRPSQLKVFQWLSFPAPNSCSDSIVLFLLKMRYGQFTCSKVVLSIFRLWCRKGKKVMYLLSQNLHTPPPPPSPSPHPTKKFLDLPLGCWENKSNWGRAMDSYFGFGVHWGALWQQSPDDCHMTFPRCRVKANSTVLHHE